MSDAFLILLNILLFTRHKFKPQLQRSPNNSMLRFLRSLMVMAEYFILHALKYTRIQKFFEILPAFCQDMRKILLTYSKKILGNANDVFLTLCKIFIKEKYTIFLSVLI
jgi:hypothetical protein